MQAAKLRHRLKFYTQTTTRSATGAVKPSKWEHTLTLWGHFAPLSDKEAINAKAVGQETTARVQIRYRSDITEKMRLEHAGKMYEITGITADNRTGREWLTVSVKNVVKSA